VGLVVLLRVIPRSIGRDDDGPGSRTDGTETGVLQRDLDLLAPAVESVARQQRAWITGSPVATDSGYSADVTARRFVPVDFYPPTSLVATEFRLEPLSPRHNEADHAAWTTSIEHIRATPGFRDGNWPPRDGMTVEQNRADLRRHADDFDQRIGFTYTVLDPLSHDVIGCVYLYPSKSTTHDVTVCSWVRADRATLDEPLADAVAQWLTEAWPWKHPDRYGR
jgi:hypothetical protein